MSENNSKKEPSITNENKDPSTKNNNNIDSKEEENDYNFLSFDFKTKNQNDNINIEPEPLFQNTKKSLDLNEQNLHEFLNYDLINSLNNEPFEENISCSKTDSSIKGNISDLSDQNSDLNSLDNFSENNYILKEKLQKKENEKIINNKIKEDKDKNIEKSINDKINHLNDPLLAPMYIPKKMRANNRQKTRVDLKEKNISCKNKFDEINLDFLINFTLNKNYEAAKKPFEIRIGDWICLFCNNLNFSFRTKCNRCGILKKSNTLLNKKKFNSNNLNYNYNYENNFNNDYLLKYLANDINNNNNF